MRRRQCRVCNGKYNHYNGDFGDVIKEEVISGKLPGCNSEFVIRLYTVECAKCGRTWNYRRKIR